MNKKIRFLARVYWRRFSMLVAVFLVLLAVLFSAARFLFPIVPGYKNDIQSLASTLLQRKVEIGEMTTDWKWFRPRLILSDVNISRRTSDELLLSADQVYLGVNLFKSLVNGKLEVDSVGMSGADVAVHRGQDGVIHVQGVSVFDPEEQNGVESERKIVIAPAMQNRTIKLSDIKLHYIDDIFNVDANIPSVSATLTLQDKDAALYMDVNLPKQFGERVELAIETEGGLDNPADVGGKVYVALVNLNLAGFNEYLWSQQAVHSGSLDAKFWLDVYHPRQIDIIGQVAATDVMLFLPVRDREAVQSWNVEQLDFKLNASTDYDAISVALIDTNFQRGGQSWSPTNIVLDAVSDEDGNYVKGTLRADFLRVQDLMPILSSTNPQLLNLTESDVEAVYGDFKNLAFSWDGSGDQVTWQGRSEFSDLALVGRKKVPGVSGVSGRLRLIDRNALVEIVSSAVRYEQPAVFRQALPDTSIFGQVYVSVAEAGARISGRSMEFVNQYVEVSSWFDVDFKKGERPFVNSYTLGEVFDASITSRYLPAKRMKPKGLRWLDQAFVSGNAKNIEFILNGPLSKMPFRNGEGVFQIDFDTEGNELNFWSPGPIARDINAHVRFLGASMTIHAHGLSVLDSIGQDVSVEIADFHNGKLLVEAPLYGSGKDALAYIEQSQLRNVFEPVIDQLELNGKQASHLSLSIPMSKGQPGGGFVVHGELHDGQLGFKDWQLNLDKMQAPYLISKKNVEVAQVSAYLNNQAVTVETKTSISGRHRVANTKLTGELDLRELLKTWEVPLLSNVSGKSVVDANIALSFSAPETAKKAPKVSVYTNLQGTSIDLPRPFSKSVESETPLSVEAVFDSSVASINMQYDKWLRGKFRIRNGDGIVELTRANIRADAGAPILPESKGITVNGYLPFLNVDQWRAMSWSDGSGSFTNKIKDIRLKVGEFQYLKRTVNNADVSMNPMPGNWRFKMQSPDVAGQVLIPKSGFKKRGLAINIEYIDFDKINRADALEFVQPGEVPPFQLTAKSLKYNKWQLQDLRALVEPVDNKVVMHSLRILDPALGAEGEGEWGVSEDGKHITSLKLSFNSNDVGEGLRRFGFAEIIKKGKGTADIDINWRSRPSDIQLSSLQGNARLALTKGQILDLEPGGGRLLGLMSLQTIPRRLSLDFTDLLSKGYRFDKMKGTFVFENGDALTDDFYIDGPVGRIDIEGRTGLAIEDYDQKILFKPDLSSSLPILGVLIGGSTGGWAVVVADRLARLFGKEADDLAQFKYTLTGSWDNPVMTPVKKKRTKTKRRKEK